MPQESKLLKIVFIQTGKTRSVDITAIEKEYYKRIGRYIKFETIVIPDLKKTKNLTEEEVKKREAELQIKEFQAGDHLILLDDKGKSYTSLKFASHLQQIMNRGVKRIVFLIGGPYGFDQTVYSKAQEKLSLSAMTFSHQIIRAIFAEQLYRAFTILNNEPYHHE